MNQQYIQLLIIVLFVGASGIGWVLRKVGEQAQKRAMEQEIQRRRLEALRTGKDVSEIPAEPTAATEQPGRPAPAGSPMDIAQRRRLQLEELRRRQAQRTRGSVGTPSVPGAPSRPRPVPLPGGSGPTVPTVRSPSQQPQRGAARPSAPSPSRRPGTQSSADAARREAIQRQQERARRKIEEQARQQAAEARRREQTLAESESSTHRLVQDVSPTEGAYAFNPQAVASPASAATGGARVVPPRTGDRRARGALLGGKELNAQEARRALVLSEILSPPLSLRD
ncbi:MAG: hypothetical protein IT435_16655 [Phycisphaerales bacterium]|nr:hypothetical protein [Phycisphaerales bacterium]